MKGGVTDQVKPVFGNLSERRQGFPRFCAGVMEQDHSMFALKESFKLKLRDIFRDDADCDL
ncbi:MAG: hypothetical protein QXZ06_08115, partial [Candidatus Jordarchaeales archaeon]